MADSDSAPPKKVLVLRAFYSFNGNDIKCIEQASKLGDVHVLIKNRENAPNTKYMLESIRFVSAVRIVKESLGAEIDDLKPDIFYTDRHDESQRKLMESKHIQYVVAPPTTTDDEKQLESASAPKSMDELKRENIELRKLCTALKSLSDGVQTTNNQLKKQNIELQKQLVNCFSLLSEKMTEDDEAQNNDNYDENDDDETENACIICYGGIEDEQDAVVIEECGHKFHIECCYQSISADIFSKKTPVCAICDMDGKHVPIPKEVCAKLLQSKGDDYLLQEYEKLSTHEENVQQGK